MRPSLSFIASTTASTAWRYALAFFLVVVAIGLAYLLVKAAKALASVDKMVSDLDREIVPLMGKVGTTVDEVNAELDKVNEITSSVVDMTQKIDSTTRAVESALSTPAKKAAAFSSGPWPTPHCCSSTRVSEADWPRMSRTIRGGVSGTVRSPVEFPIDYGRTNQSASHAVATRCGGM